MNRYPLAALMALALLAGPAISTNYDIEADQVTADLVAECGAESADLQLAVYLAEATERTQHPTTTHPARRRHVSTLPESDQ
jgi:hypothetical protein